MRSRKGFSLTELMIVVAIMGVLAAIAYPLYTNYLAGGKRSEASSNLEQLRLMEEEYFSLNGRYGPADATYTGTAAIQAYLTEWKPPNTGMNYTYVITVSNTGANFTAGAVPTANAPTDTVVDAGTGAAATINQDNQRQGAKFW
jgi:type IV pilus assembly protein PilE